MKTFVRVRFVIETKSYPGHCIKMQASLPLPEKVAVKDGKSGVTRFFRKSFVVIDCQKKVQFWWETGETIYKEISYERFGLEEHPIFYTE